MEDFDQTLDVNDFIGRVRAAAPIVDREPRAVAWSLAQALFPDVAGRIAEANGQAAAARHAEQVRLARAVWSFPNRGCDDGTREFLQNHYRVSHEAMVEAGIIKEIDDAPLVITMIVRPESHTLEDEDVETDPISVIREVIEGLLDNAGSQGDRTGDLTCYIQSVEPLSTIDEREQVAYNRIASQHTVRTER